MIPFLPPEIVRPIIESSVPPASQYRLYGDRQFILRQVCLVSRLFREIAQPLLRQVVLIDKDSKFWMIKKLGNSPGWAPMVRQMMISMGREAGLSDKVKELASAFRNITDLVITSSHRAAFDMFSLSYVPRLRTCEIKCHKPYRSKKNHLPNLFSLTLTGDYSNSALDQLLISQSLPALRILALLNITNSSLLDLQLSNLRPHTLKLLAQLDNLYLPATALPGSTLTWIKPFLSKTLVDLDIRDPRMYKQLLVHLQHVRLPPGRRSLEGVTQVLDERSEVSLQSVYIHIRYRGLQENTDLRSFLSSCERHRIEVIYEGEVTQDWNIKPGISEEFCCRQRERGRLEAASTT